MKYSRLECVECREKYERYKRDYESRFSLFDNVMLTAITFGTVHIMKACDYKDYKNQLKRNCNHMNNGKVKRD